MITERARPQTSGQSLMLSGLESDHFYVRAAIFYQSNNAKFLNSTKTELVYNVFLENFFNSDSGHYVVVLHADHDVLLHCQSRWYMFSYRNTEIQLDNK